MRPSVQTTLPATSNRPVNLRKAIPPNESHASTWEHSFPAKVTMAMIDGIRALGPKTRNHGFQRIDTASVRCGI